MPRRKGLRRSDSMRRDVAAKRGLAALRCVVAACGMIRRSISAPEMKLFACTACRLIFTVYNQTEPRRLDIVAD